MSTVDVTEHDLYDTRPVAQVDEGDAAVVASRRDPPGEHDVVARVLLAQRAGVVGPNHCILFSMSATTSVIATAS